MKTTSKIALSIVTSAILSVGINAACTADVDMDGNTITGLKDPEALTDAVSLGFLAKAINGSPDTSGITAPTGYEVIYKGRMAWLDRNVGADASPASWDDTTQNTLGSLFQWGRPADEHQFRDMVSDNNDADVDGTADDTTTECSTVDAPVHTLFITGANASGGYNWRTTVIDCNADARRTHFWSAPGSLNSGICPAGWRVPLESDFAQLDIVSAEDAYTKIKLSTAGYRSYLDASIHNVGSNGYYWASTVDGDRSRFLYIYSGGTFFHSNNRAYGFSVRCVKHQVD